MIRREQDEPDPFVEPGLAHPHRHGEDAEHEEDGVLHEGPGDLVDGHDREDVHDHRHHHVGGAERQSLRPPQERAEQEQKDHKLGQTGHLILVNKGLTSSWPPSSAGGPEFFRAEQPFPLSGPDRP